MRLQNLPPQWQHFIQHSNTNTNKAILPNSTIPYGPRIRILEPMGVYLVNPPHLKTLYTLVSTLQRTEKNCCFLRGRIILINQGMSKTKIRLYQQVATTLEDSRNIFLRLALVGTSMGPTYETSRVTLLRSQYNLNKCLLVSPRTC